MGKKKVFLNLFAAVALGTSKKGQGLPPRAAPAKEDASLRNKPALVIRKSARWEERASKHNAWKEASAGSRKQRAEGV
jgi:hypothetical protein